jgi:hypothetical protein
MTFFDLTFNMRFRKTFLCPGMVSDGIAESPSMHRLPALLGRHEQTPEIALRKL